MPRRYFISLANLKQFTGGSKCCVLFRALALQFVRSDIVKFVCESIDFESIVKCANAIV